MSNEWFTQRARLVCVASEVDDAQYNERSNHCELENHQNEIDLVSNFQTDDVDVITI